MQFRGLLIAAAVLALLGGGVYWSNRAKEEQAKSPELPKDASPKVLTIQESEIAQLEFRKKGMPPTIVKRAGEGRWTITEPQQLGADSDALANVTGVLANFTSETVAPAPADLSAFGLKDPLFTLNIVKKDGKQVAVEVGDNVPVTGAVFVKVAGDPRVFTVGATNRSSLDKQWSDLRDKRLLTIENDKLSRVELSANGKTFEFGKNQANEWQIVKPNPYRADTWGVDELVRKLKDAKLDPASPPADMDKAATAFVAATPVAIARLTDATGTQQLEVRKTVGKDPVYYAKSSAVEGVHKVQADLATALSKPVSDYRNKKLFDFGFTDPSKLDMKIDGKTKSCGKNGEKWICDTREVKPETVSAFVDKIRDLSAKQFLETPAKLSGSEIEITVTTTDAKKTETVRILGNHGARGDEPAMYELDPASVDGIKQAFAAIKEPDKPAADAGAKKK
jgi:hypothetical protein